MQTFSFLPTQNVYVLSFSPNTNFSGENVLFVGQFSGDNSDYRSLLQFDVSFIPIGSTIIEARLKLFISRNDEPGLAKPTGVFRLLDNFDEGTVTFNSQPSADSIAADTTIINAEIATFITWEITDLVTGWYNGSIPNNGIIMIGVEDEPSLTGFRSTYFSDSSKWPLLEIDFVQGITTQFSEENPNTTDSFTGSNSISLGPISATFAIKNTGATNNAEVKLQISPDGTTWFDNNLPFVSVATLGPGETVTLNTDGNMAFARVAYKSQNVGQSTSLSIFPATTESV
ncbi:DNRLRE domain-containing protein [Wukongibacter sp. M2B1]|uniref:DNRLRE domain-containing protein n=1 Tax=Wukongibacter sp. M2B1 TaxID=3088895 RepID=UPI003D7BC2C5